MLKTSGYALAYTLSYALGFQHSPQDLANVNEWKIMFDPYIQSGHSLGFNKYFEESMYLAQGHNPAIVKLKPKNSTFCAPPFRRKPQGHSFRLSVLPYVCPSFCPSVPLCTLCAQLLQFYSNLFETLQMSLSCFEDMHSIWV